jgi:general secretion pathway protein D
MVITNRNATLRAVILLVVMSILAGCASYKGQLAFEEAEQLAAEENYDSAVEKYFEALQLQPDSKTYKLKLISTRTRAAGFHIRKARELREEGKIESALEQYRLARGFDPSLEIAAFEETQLLKTLKAEELVAEAMKLIQDDQMPAAHKLIREAMQLAPNNAQVLELSELLDNQKQVVTLDGIDLDVSSTEPLTLHFKKAKTKEVFNVLNKLTGINFILDEDVRDQPISVFLEKASFAQALQLVLQMNGLEKKVLNSKTIIIYPLSREKDKQYGDQIIQTFYLSHIDAKKAVNLLRTMLQLRKIYVHEERNALVIRDKPEVIQLAEQILSAADRANSEVLFALELVSVSSGDDLLFGPQLDPYSVSVGFSKDGENIVRGGLTGGGSTDGLVQSLNGLQTFYTLPTATFDLKKTLQDTEILASPKIRVRNREKAKVHIGTREPVVTTTTTDISTSANVQYVDVGVKVDVEPVIQLDNTVETKLRLEVSQVIGRENLDGVTALTISTTNAETVLTLQDGVQTILGGLFEQVEDSNRTTIPILGDIPLMGSLFTNYNDSDKKREILLSITPYIIKQVVIPGADIATIWSGGEDNFKVGPNFGAFNLPLESEVQIIKPQSAPSLIPASTGLKPAPKSVRPAVKGSDANIGPAKSPGEVTAPADRQGSGGTPAAAAPQAGIKGGTAASLSLAGPRNVGVGEEFVLAVQIDDAEALFSAPLFVNYDPLHLTLVDLEEGGFLGRGNQKAIFSSNQKKDAGQVIVGYKQADGQKGASGSGTLFNLRFKAREAGSALVDLNRLNFRNPQGTRLSVDAAEARIEIH